MNESEIFALKEQIAQIVGSGGRIAYDKDARVMTLLATQVPASPIVLEFYEDGCVYILTGASTFFTISDASSDEDYLLGIISAIVDGQCEEAVARSGDGGLRIWSGIVTADGSSQEIPKRGFLVKWRLPDWRGELTAPKVSRKRRLKRSI